MAYVKATYSASIKAVLDAAAGTETANQDLADALADALEVAIASFVVTVTSVSGVTTGPGVSGPGAGTVS